FSDFPAVRYSSTASRRNSGGYGFLKLDPLGMAEHPSCPAGQCRPSAQMSTKPGALQSHVRLGFCPPPSLRPRQRGGGIGGRPPTRLDLLLCPREDEPAVVGAECVRCGRRDRERGAEILLKIQPEDGRVTPVALCRACATAAELVAMSGFEQLTDDEKVATVEWLLVSLLPHPDCHPTPLPTSRPPA